MEICTERCLIRQFEEQDIPDFMVYRNDMDWMKYQGFKGLTEQEYRTALLGTHPFQDGVQFAVIHKESAALIGDVYLKQEYDAFWKPHLKQKSGNARTQFFRITGFSKYTSLYFYILLY